MLGGIRERGGPSMAIERIEIDLVKLPFVHFFETSLERSYGRTFSLIKVCEDGICGWGECVAEDAPLYSERDGRDGLVCHEAVPHPPRFPQGHRRARGLRPRGGRLPGQPDGQGRDRAGALGPEGQEGRRPAPPALRRRPDRDRGRRQLRHRGLPAGPRRPDRRLSGPGLQADQDQDQARLGRRGLRRRPREVSRHHAPGRRQRRLRPQGHGDAQGARRLRHAHGRTAVRTLRPVGARQAPAGDEDAGLPRRERPVRRHDPGGPGDGQLPGRQHQGRAGRRLRRGAPDPRSLPGGRRAGLVRRHARMRHRPGPQPAHRLAPELQVPERPQRQPPVLQGGPDRPGDRAQRAGDDPRPGRAGHRRQPGRIAHRPGLAPQGSLQIRRGQTYFSSLSGHRIGGCLVPLEEVMKSRFDPFF
ncbi:MAG: hypothetical protein MZV63_66075 [Marinilabiliales bacterium]|nr:hypothetical protein [Marinilabiliales bacterium]